MASPLHEAEVGLLCLAIEEKSHLNAHPAWVLSYGCAQDLHWIRLLYITKEGLPELEPGCQSRALRDPRKFNNQCKWVDWMQRILGSNSVNSLLITIFPLSLSNNGNGYLAHEDRNPVSPLFAQKSLVCFAVYLSQTIYTIIKYLELSDSTNFRRAPPCHVC